MTGRRIGLLGGTFDPIHRGHIDLARAAEDELGLMRLFVITSHVPPHRQQPSASSHHRFAMVSLAVAGRRHWRASDVELRSPAPSYTSTTLHYFHERGYGPSELFFVIGADAFAEIGSWRDYPAILDLTNFAVVSRPGFRVDELRQRLPMLAHRMVRPPIDGLARTDPMIILIDVLTPDVSSTAIRSRIAAGEPIGALVPSAVEQHIEQHGLYTSMTPGRRASDTPWVPAAGRLHGEE